MSAYEGITAWAIVFAIGVGLTFALALLLKRLFPKLHVAARYFVASLAGLVILAILFAGT
jgi:hypothetical protein